MSDTALPDFVTTPATPDYLVALIPCPWPMIAGEALEEIHGEHWQEMAEFEINEVADDTRCIAHGEVRFEGEVVVAQIVVEHPIEGIEQSISMSMDPLTQAEALMMQQHQSLWRIMIPAGKRLGRRAAKRMSQLLATFVEAGGSAAFMPGIMRLHSTRVIKKHTMDLFDPQSLANLFVGAWHEGDWMRTRGLTAFELPEVEIATAEGLNAAYFHLMDVSANMLMQMAQFPSGAELQVGHQHLTIHDAPEVRLDDPRVPSNGTYGVQRVSK